ncbi:MAG: glucose-6-phosphate dehydrogenase [Planctomycetales bacterium]|nr:glucose-6-phosphate dehydrogenase [Planctomycetales bacterium]
MTPSNSTTAAAPPDDCVMVIFGASGDLAKRLLLPAIHNLARNSALPNNFAIVGVAKDEFDSPGFRAQLVREMKEIASDPDPDYWKTAFDNGVHYLAGDFEDENTYQQLKACLDKIANERQMKSNCIFYLAVPPSLFGTIVEHLSRAELVKKDADGEQDAPWRRVIVEKPFGHDVESANALNRKLQGLLDENQIYRIDHYLGKETVQNILVFRFANGIFEPLWNRRYIDHVQITVSETVGVEHRGLYYDRAGALRDMVPNHIFQLLALIGMEAPASFHADAVRDEKAKLLRAIRPMAEADVRRNAVRGQYGAGRVNGNAVSTYRSAPQVSEDSMTETFVALRMFIDNWRWADVPFYIRTGKSMPKRLTEIAIQFRRAPFLPFRETAVEQMRPNQLVIRIQPNEGISLQFEAKRPGILVNTDSVDMDFCYDEYFGSTAFIGYETLLYDCMIGDPTLFQRADFVEAGWRAIEPILNVWGATTNGDFPNYAAGSWGPDEAEQLMSRDGRYWRTS